FGYIECGEAYSSPEKCYAVKRFVEKPNLELAEEYIQSKHYLWNSGMFCFKAGTLANEFLAHAKTLFTMATHCFEASEQTKNAV
ncbi:sugar phosphate nucleotidyltransferase, partial [Klebsiella pneumoniae]|nr:sugar phosphate nucleotidyltransferase [Klebsiella pneumoniae]